MVDDTGLRKLSAVSVGLRQAPPWINLSSCQIFTVAVGTFEREERGIHTPSIIHRETLWGLSQPRWSAEHESHTAESYARVPPGESLFISACPSCARSFQGGMKSPKYKLRLLRGVIGG